MADIAVHFPPEKIVESELDERIQAIESVMAADVIAFVGSFLFGLEEVFRDQAEGIAGGAEKKEKIVVVLETEGGYIEVVQRVVETLRHHYSKVEFVVPIFAMSAGTVLVMSGDAVHMDYFSIPGPIDPQVGRANGEQVPALGYPAQYKKLIEKADHGALNTAELAILIEKSDQAELYRYEQARKLSISLLEEWLVKYKCKDWKKAGGKPHGHEPDVQAPCNGDRPKAEQSGPLAFSRAGNLHGSPQTRHQSILLFMGSVIERHFGAWGHIP